MNTCGALHPIDHLRNERSCLVMHVLFDLGVLQPWALRTSDGTVTIRFFLVLLLREGGEREHYRILITRKIPHPL